jgi:sugar transferase (PEP-CTERM/EpsH1 system associated)
MSDTETRQSPLIAHIIHRLDFGGLENGLVNLINRIPASRYRHAIICMTDYSDFSKRITNPAVTLHALHKPDGKGIGVYWRLWKLLRRLRPDIVHTRNLSAIEGAVVAALAGVPYSVHGEHGRDSQDIDGLKRKYLLLRRACRPFIDHYIAVSQDLETWLVNHVGVPPRRIHQIHNGVDSVRFYPASGGRRPLPKTDFAQPPQLVIGTVGRLQEVKDQLTLVRAFARLAAVSADVRMQVRLVIVGDGPLAAEVQQLVRHSGIEDLTWQTGARNDIPELLQGMDIFVLPSKAEGISNTILEAMACGLPVVATAVGGNPELVEDGQTGSLVPPNDPDAMARALQRYVQQRTLIQDHGRAGRRRVEQAFSMTAMVERYLEVYDSHGKAKMNMLTTH